MTTAVGEIAFARRYWQCRCGAEGGSYAADAVLGVEGERTTVTVQRHCCKMSAGVSFADASEQLNDTLGVELAPETVRQIAHRHGGAMQKFQRDDEASDEAFRKAAGEVEFAIDAGKVNTREDGWRDLKIGVISKRESAKSPSPEQASAGKSPRLPAATMVLAFAAIAASKTFRRSWAPRLRDLGVTCWADVHVLADGASWIWKSVGRALTGCVETLDFWHACQHLSKCAKSIFGEETPETKAAYRRGRALLAREGWAGVCRWVAELLGQDKPDANGGGANGGGSSMSDAERERRRPYVDRMLAYFSKHLTRLNYAERTSKGRAIGSGQVEGKAKTLGLRLKARGARWNRRNVDKMASLVCVRRSPQQWAAYWALAA